MSIQVPEFTLYTSVFEFSIMIDDADGNTVAGQVLRIGPIGDFAGLATAQQMLAFLEKGTWDIAKVLAAKQGGGAKARVRRRPVVDAMTPTEFTEIPEPTAPVARPN